MRKKLNNAISSIRTVWMVQNIIIFVISNCTVFSLLSIEYENYVSMINHLFMRC